MKEHTYGWYPSAKNIYTERRMGAPTPYQLEAMYRFRDSKYYEPAITPPEQRTPKPPRPTPTPTAQIRRPTSTMSRASHQTPQCDEGGMGLQVRARSAPIHTSYKRPPKLQIPTPQQCWSTHVPETEITIVPPTVSPAPMYSPYIPDSTLSPPPQLEESTATKIERIKSATIRRDTPSKPQRPVKSAGPIRPASTSEHLSISASPVPRPPSQGFDRSSPKRSSSRTPSRPLSRPSSRPNAPSLYQMEAVEELELQREGTPDYDEQCRKYGWMAEVHGDPLKLKRVTTRLPYTVKVAIPETERDPPKVHMENLETFFLNTIPRRPMAFTIDKEWISEMIHAKRMEMQKKHGMQYRYKNFSFVY